MYSFSDHSLGFERIQVQLYSASRIVLSRSGEVWYASVGVQPNRESRYPRLKTRLILDISTENSWRELA